MAEIKTKQTTASVNEYIEKIADEEQRKDAKQLLTIFKTVTKEQPKIWGSSIIGYGKYHYKSERSSQEGDWPLTAFSARKGKISIYIMSGFNDQKTLLKTLGTCKTSKGCLYVKKLSDIHIPTLKKLIASSVKIMKKRYPEK